MSQPSVTINEIDGALGVLPGGEKLLAIVGVSSTGTANAPATYARSKDIIAAFGAGPAVEAACLYVEQYQRPCLFVRTGQTVAGTPGTIDVTGKSGTSVVTITLAPNDDYEFYFKVIAGGTIGVAGITFQWSLDGGRTLSPVTALGTANTFAFPGAGLTQLNFAAGTLVAGDVIISRGTAPQWNTAELTTALTALQNSAVSWGIVEIVGSIDANAFDAIESAMSALSSAGRPKAWVGNARTPNVAETEAAYLTALTTIFSSKATVYGELCAGACKLSSAVSGRKYRRPISFKVAAEEASSAEHIDIADVNRGSLTGVSIRDANGNPDEHDESINPGLDDARFTVLRTWDGLAGVYVNRPRLFSAAGSDFFIMPHRRVMNLARDTLRVYFIRRLSQPILVSTSTGYILEEEALEIENGADALLRAVLLATPKASGGGFEGGSFVKLSRTDNLLSTRKLTGQGRIVPLAYVEFIDFDIGFFNPALQVQAA